MKCVFIGGRHDGWETDLDHVWAIANGKTSDLSAERARGRLVHRAELDNQPTVDGYCGPMWDGNQLRYEDWEVYELLSR